MAGEALGPVLKYLEFDGVSASFPFPIHLDGEYYAVTYWKSSTSSWLKTFRIIADGTISEIDTWEFSVAKCRYPRLTHISGDLYVLSHNIWDGTYYRGRLKTLHISNTGVITKSFDDTYNIPLQIKIGFLMQITGAYYTLIVCSTPNDHYVYTFTIIAGAAGISLVDSYNLPNRNYGIEAAGKIGTNIFFALWSDTGSYTITTVEVSSVGAITTPFVQEKSFAINCAAFEFNTVQISQNIYALSARDHDTDEVAIQTIYISNAGAIQTALAGSLNFGTALNNSPGICKTDTPNLYFSTYGGTLEDGFIDIIEISPGGVISSPAEYSPYEFDTGHAQQTQPLPANGIWMPVFYTGPDGDGWIKTITFTPPVSAPHHEMIMKIGP